MATTTSPPATPPARLATIATGAWAASARVGGGEFWWWLFMRVSGLLLLVLALGHLVIMHLFETGAERIDFGFVATRWESPFWRTWDWMLLMLALVHGVNGLRNITLDYVKRSGTPPRDHDDLRT